MWESKIPCTNCLKFSCILEWSYALEIGDFLFWWTSYSVSFCLIQSLFQGGSSRTFMVSLHWDIYLPISFIVDTTKMFTLIPVWMILTFIQSQLFWYAKTSVLMFLKNLESMWSWMKFSMLPQPLGFLKLILDLFPVIDIQWRALYLGSYNYPIKQKLV